VSDEASRVLVIGGSGVLGAELCRALKRDGARVALTFCSAEGRAHELGTELEAAAVLQLDLRQAGTIRAAVDAAAEALGGLDAFVFCAGVGVTTAPREGPSGEGPQEQPTLSEIDEAAWDAMLAVNTKGPFFAVQAAERHLVAAGGGNVVLVGSVDGTKALPGPMHYAVSKGALDAMARAFGKHLGAAGIRTTVISPGILVDGLSRTIETRLLDEYEKHCGLKRRGELSEAADVISWFAIRNTYVTGQTVLLDGAL